MAKRSTRFKIRPASTGLLFPTSVGLALFLIVMQWVATSGNVLVVRYLAGHWVNKTTTAMALIGIVALLQSALRVLRQFYDTSEYAPPAIEPMASGGAATRAAQLREMVGRTSRKLLGDYRQQRLLAAAASVEQLGGSDRLDEELKYLSDIDAQRQADKYAFVRILIWAIPMLGFLGTVLGITQALASIQIGPENDFQQMMNGLKTGLYVAFDTTAQALLFAIALMFVQFIVVRIESQLLEHVDQQVRRDLSGWFAIESSGGDVYVRTVQQMGRSILAATHEMSQTQIELWKRSIEAAQAAWLASIENNHQIIQHNLSDAIESAVGRLGQRLDESIHRADSALEHRGQQWQVHLSQLTRQTHDQQQLVIATTQSMLSALSERPATTAIGPSHLLESVNLSRTLQQLARSLDTFNAHLAQLGAEVSGNPADSAQDSAKSASGSLRIFPEDAAA